MDIKISEPTHITSLFPSRKVRALRKLTFRQVLGTLLKDYQIGVSNYAECNKGGPR